MDKKLFTCVCGKQVVADYGLSLGDFSKRTGWKAVLQYSGGVLRVCPECHEKATKKALELFEILGTDGYLSSKFYKEIILKEVIMGYWEQKKEKCDKIIPLIDWQEVTRSIYRLARIVVEDIYPELITEFPEFDYTDEQERRILELLVKIQSSDETRSRYQEI
jgi:hypothetical protein